MSRCLANDSSLHGQFATLTQFLGSIRFWQRAYSLTAEHGLRLEVSRKIANRAVIAELSMRELLGQQADRETKRAILSWLDKSGPFWDDAPSHSAAEYFECGEELVTDTALAEICMLSSLGERAVPISLVPSSFEATNLTLKWVDRAAGDFQCDVPNFISEDSLTEYLRSACPPITTWPKLLAWAQAQFPELLLSSEIIDQLPTTFYPNVAQRACVLLRALNDISLSTKMRQTDQFNELRTQWMEGGYARITDSSDSEKNDYKDELTFRHPESGEKVLCGWHAKIKTPQFRIHFQWPKHSPESRLFVAYIGPKITV